MNKQKTYQYVITLKKPEKPRTLYHDLTILKYLNKNLISVQDLQDDTHIYGNTYTLNWYKRKK